MEGVRKESPFAGMPLELVRAIVGKLDVNEDTCLAVLPAFLLVSKAIKAMAEELHPETLSYYRQRIAEHLVKHPSQVLALQMAGSPALAQLEDLNINFKGWRKPAEPSTFKDLAEGVVSDRRIESVNALMVLCPKLRDFRWNLYGKKVRRWDQMELWRSSSLRELEFRGIVPVNKGGALDLSNALTLESFTMTYDNAVDTLSSASSPRLQLPPNVQRLKLGLGMGWEALERLGIPDLPCLTDLSLSRNLIGAEGIRHLQVGTSRTLKKLILNGTGGGNAVIQALALDGNEVLQELDISWNEITDPSLLHLERNTSLHTLSLSGNSLENLEFGLDRNSTLRKLHLNYLDGHGRAGSDIRSLSRQLGENATLQSLLLNWSDLTDDTLAGLELPASSGLRVLDLRGNSVSKATENRLSSQVKGLEVMR